MVKKERRPVRDGLIKSIKRTVFIVCGEQSCIARSDRTLRDGRLFERIPGSELPGYDHPVPSGQQTVNGLELD
jgi:hypothetical protein